MVLPTQPYGFRQKYLPTVDLMLTEIIKPNIVLPFTLLTFRYSEDEGRSIFTDIWVSSEWGNTSADQAFLEELWKHLRPQDPPLDLDALMMKAEQACVPTPGQLPRARPFVYRRGLEDVLRHVTERYHLNTSE